MEIFIAQRVSGEDMNKLKEESNKIIEILKQKGHDCYCTLNEDDSFQEITKKEMMAHAFEKINNSDALLVIMRNENKSEGMLMEVGYVLAKKKNIILLIKSDVKNTYLRDIADKIIEFEDVGDLYDKLKEIEL